MKNTYIITLNQTTELKVQIEALTVELAKEIALYDTASPDTIVVDIVIKNREILKVEQENNIELE